MNDKQKIYVGLGIGAGLIVLLSSSKSTANFATNPYKGTPDTKKPSSITPAVFNNNPLNIKPSKDKYGVLIASNFYPGEVTAAGAKHRMFENWGYGTAAGMIHLWRYINAKVNGGVYPSGTRLDTIEKIVSTWAPKSDSNDTEGYINYVVSKTGIARNTVLQFTKTTIVSLTKVMAFREDNKGASFVNEDVLTFAWVTATKYLKL